MRLTITTICFLLVTFYADARPFITTWEASTTDLTIDLPVDPNYSTQYDYDIDTDDDGVYDFTGITGSFQHTFPSAGIYTIRIKGDYPNPYFIGSTAALNDQLISLDQWGDIEWKSMKFAFSSVTTNFLTTDVPDLSQVTDMSYMFSFSEINNLDVSRWDVSLVSNMYAMFFGVDVSDPGVSNWDVSSVADMGFMFGGTTVANPDVSRWDVSSVTDMSYMFYYTTRANPDVNNWVVSSVTDMSGMFLEATSANPDLSNWQITDVVDMSEMFDNSGLSTRNYDYMLSNFANQNVMNNVNFSAGNTPYCETTSRTILTNNYNWNITDGGFNCLITDVAIELSNVQVLDGNNPQLMVLVKNQGYLTANNVAVSLVLDTSTSNAFWTCDHSGYSCGGTSGPIFDTISSMVPGAVVTYTINFDTSTGDGQEVNAIGSVSPQPGIVDPTPADNLFDENIRIIKSIFKSNFE